MPLPLKLVRTHGKQGEELPCSSLVRRVDSNGHISLGHQAIQSHVDRSDGHVPAGGFLDLPVNRGCVGFGTAYPEHGQQHDGLELAQNVTLPHAPLPVVPQSSRPWNPLIVNQDILNKIKYLWKGPGAVMGRIGRSPKAAGGAVERLRGVLLSPERLRRRDPHGTEERECGCGEGHHTQERSDAEEHLGIGPPDIHQE